MSVSAVSAAAYGMSKAVNRFERAAINTANASGDIVSNFVEQIEAKHAFDASLQTFRSADEMIGRVLDLKA